MLWNNGEWMNAQVGDFYTEAGFSELYMKFKNNHTNHTHPRDNPDWLIIDIKNRTYTHPFEYKLQRLEEKCRELESERYLLRSQVNMLMLEVATLRELIKHAVICSDPQLLPNERKIDI